jgi:hypothetical protein
MNRTQKEEKIVLIAVIAGAVIAVGAMVVLWYLREVAPYN